MAMAAALRRRGPDASGVMFDTQSGVLFSHARLAIVDLSSAGAQPMVSPSGRYWLVLNGEIYNHLELRERLASSRPDLVWRGHSDTETLIAAIECWGLEAALSASYGMFALGLWDRQDHVLTLARDRAGEKPVYFGKVGEAFAFASELRALRRLPGFDNRPDPEAMAAMLTYQYVPDPLSIHAGVAKVRAGHLVEVRGGVAGAQRAWWDQQKAIEQSSVARRLPMQDAPDQFEALLVEVVRSQMLSDVPLGSFLSGGIDSSLVTAILQQQSGGRVKTYSIGFTDPRFNEAPHARAVAEHLGTEHTEAIFEPADALALIPDLHRYYDEPFADCSQLPTLLLSRLARQDITVALTGDGGDELFGGYPRFQRGAQVWARNLAYSSPGLRARAKLARGAGHLAALTSSAFDAVGLGSLHPANLPGRLGRAARLFANRDDPGAFHDDFARIPGGGRALLPEQLRAQLEDPRLPCAAPELFSDLGMARWLMASDAASYLPGDILVKVDRAAMAFSLETRAPLLDARILDFGWSLSDAALFGADGGKQIMRDVLFRHVPRHLIDRPKQGFIIPLDDWLRGPLSGWAEDLLAPAALARTAVFDGKRINRLWRRLKGGEAGLGYPIWSALMLQSWLMADDHDL
jgi:asparagine synthase (glutamine-hydrolysing)